MGAGGEMQLGVKCIKYMLLSVSGMFAVTAALVVCVGSTVFSFYHDVSFLVAARAASPAALLVAAGALMLAVSLFGCVGAFRESVCLINLFALVLGLVLVLELSVAGAAYSLRRRVPDLLDDSLRRAVDRYPRDREVADAFDFLHTHLNCCGVDSYSDWARVSEQLAHGILVSNNLTVPYSCCALSEYALAGELTAQCVQLYANGCLPRMISLVSQSAALLATGAMTIAIVQVIGIVFSVMLGRALRRAKSERELRRCQIREQMLSYHMLGGEPKPVVYVPANYTIG